MSKKIIIDCGEVVKKNIYEVIKAYCCELGQCLDVGYKARNRKKLLKIILNGKKVGYHVLDKINKTLYIETKEEENLTIYSDK